MSRRCCCGCDVWLEDDFNRSDNDDPGSDWSEDSGDWDISSNTLICSSAAGLLVTTAESTGSKNEHVNVTASCSSQGTAFRVIFDYVDANNYHFAQFDLLTDNDGVHYYCTLSVYNRTSGANSLVYSATPYVANGSVAASYLCSVCTWSDGTISVVFDGPGFPTSITCASTLKGGTKTGLYVDSGSWTFDNFKWQQRNSQCDDCDTACAVCSEGAQALPIQADFDGFADAGCSDCDTLNASFEVPFDVEGSSVACQWDYLHAATACSATDALIRIGLEYSFGNYRVYVWFWYTGDTTGPYAYFEENLGSTQPDCNTFSNLEITYIATFGGGTQCGGTPTCHLTTVS